jgi:hypothetical protein
MEGASDATSSSMRASGGSAIRDPWPGGCTAQISIDEPNDAGQAR